MSGYAAVMGLSLTVHLCFLLCAGQGTERRDATRAAFVEWLLDQCGRDDDVGQLAKWWRRRNPQWKLAQEAFGEDLAAAWEEYEKSATITKTGTTGGLQGKNGLL